MRKIHIILSRFVLVQSSHSWSVALSPQAAAVPEFVKTGNPDRQRLDFFGQAEKLKSPNEAKDYEEVGIETAEGPQPRLPRCA